MGDAALHQRVTIAPAFRRRDASLRRRSLPGSRSNVPLGADEFVAASNAGRALRLDAAVAVAQDTNLSLRRTS